MAAFAPPPLLSWRRLDTVRDCQRWIKMDQNMIKMALSTLQVARSQSISFCQYVKSSFACDEKADLRRAEPWHRHAVLMRHLLVLIFSAQL